MNILLILLLILLILLILKLFIRKEGFQNNTIDPDVIQNYNTFMSFYTPFCTNWENAIKASVASTIQQQPLTDPKQVQSQSAPPISEEDMNNYITELEQQLSQPLPRICKSLPGNIDSNSLPQILQDIPSDPQPYMNALSWMNIQLEKSHSNLNNALQGNSPSVEGFDTCQNLAACIANNPEIAKELEQQIATQNAQTQAQQEQQLTTIINPFITNSQLYQALSQNQQLVQKSQDIQNQAQSGQLYSQINTPDSNKPSNPTQLPPGADTLTKKKSQDPAQYDSLQKTAPQFFAIKQLIEQINATL